MDEKIISFHPTILMMKGSPLTSNVNRIISHAFEGGLISKWNENVQRKATEQHLESAYGLGVKEYSPLFVFLLFGGAILATLSFCAECLIYRQIWKSPHSLIWNFLAKFFDGERHYLKDLPATLMKHTSKRRTNKLRELFSKRSNRKTINVRNVQIY